MVIYFVTSNQPRVFQGRVKGRVVSPRGDTRFQWDQIFMPKGYDMTFSEMSVEEKNRVSHRRKAFEKFRKWLENNNKLI